MITSQQMQEMRSLRDSLTIRLIENPPEGEDYENREDYSAGSTSKFIPDSIDYVNKAFRNNRLDVLRAMDKFMLEYEAEPILRACEALRSNGIDDTYRVLTAEMIERTDNLINNLRMLVLKSHVSIPGEQSERLKARALGLLMEDLSREERIIYLVLECRVIDPEQLAIRVKDMDSIPNSLIDGSL